MSFKIIKWHNTTNIVEQIIVNINNNDIKRTIIIDECDRLCKLLKKREYYSIFTIIKNILI